MLRSIQTIRVLSCSCLLTVFVATAGAAEMNLGIVFSSGSVPPSNPSGPWLEYSLLDLGPNSILFTLTATANMTDPEKIGSFYFNFDDALTVADLGFSAPGVVGAFTVPTISKSMNGLKADGDGWYDLRLDFSTSGGLANYFSSGDSLTYVLTYAGAGTANAASFEFQSQPGGSEGTYFAAAHILSTPAGGTGSAWLGATSVTATTIPEPTSAALVLAAVALFGLRRRA